MNVNHFLKIDKGESTPEVELNGDHLFIEGISMPENSTVFYDNIREKLSYVLSDITNDFEVKLFLEYINTSSSLHILKIISDTEKFASESQYNITITWMYDDDDDDMYDSGLLYQDFTEKCNFIFKAI